VPNVTALPVQQAQQRLTSAGFASEVKRVASTRPKGVVLDQSPLAGVTAVRGTTVTLIVSSGAKPVVVPQVVGQSQGSAVNALTGVRLKPVLQNVGSAKPAGTVVAQKPKAGSEVDKGSKVTLNISTGTGPATTTTVATTTTSGATTTAAKVRAPRVVGLAEAPALRRLNVLGLLPTVVFERSNQPAGRVLSQSPAAGSTLRRGSRVRVVVSTGPNPQRAASVPNVTGQDQATAADNLRSAGFRVLVLNRPTTNQGQDGVVVERQPRAGSNIPARSLVAIFIGRFSG
jgi:serine/threonine-protein kinase